MRVEADGSWLDGLLENGQHLSGQGAAVIIGVFEPQDGLGQRTGDMRLAAPRVLVVYAEGAGQIDRLEATGGVTLVSGEEAAEADRADYNVADGTVVMVGNVLLTQGENALTSDRMVVNLDDGTAQMDGRVRTVFQPDEEAPQGEGQ